MRNGATSNTIWQPVTRVLVWDEAGASRSIVPDVARSMPSAVVDQVTDVDDLLQRVRASSPDLVLVTVRSRGEPGVTVVARVHAACPHARIVAMGSRADAAAMGRAVAAGARGFAILDVDGAALADPRPSAAGLVGGSRNPFPRSPVTVAVTERELQILRGMTDGYSNLEIARQLFVSEDTVKTHARRLFRKLGANDRAHAVALGMRYELVA
jgi:DNA-binding NarL/FixJ family response regulator